jgi:hypothetical protein
MARKTQHSFAKRQREQKKAEKAAQKRAKREERLNPTVTEDEVEGIENAESVEIDIDNEIPKSTEWVVGAKALIYDIFKRPATQWQAVSLFLSGTLHDCKLEGLHRSPRGGVHTIKRSHKRKGLSENRFELARVIPLHRQPTALRGSIDTECPDHQMTTLTDRSFKEPAVCMAINITREKVEDCAVMPKIEWAQARRGRYITDNPLHLACDFAAPLLGTLDGRSRDVHGCDRKACHSKLAREQRSTPTDIDDRPARRSEFSNEFPWKRRVVLMPTRLSFVFRLVHMLPMRSSILWRRIWTLFVRGTHWLEDRFR